LIATTWFSGASTALAVEVRAAVIRIDYPSLLPVSRYDLRPADLGFAGAKLANDDNGTTGRFLGDTYETVSVSAPPQEADAALRAVLNDGIRLIVVLSDAPDLLRLTDYAAADGALVLNALAPDVALRDDHCRPNLLHIAPSRAMQADAVAQFAVWKKWTDWFLISGSNSSDVAMADAYRRSARKFGAQLVEERMLVDSNGSRNTDSGHVLVQRQLPLFTQDARDHDIVVAADESDYFARYLTFHTWSPRPIAGSGGLRPVSFHGAHEAWGATQFQTRFETLTQRYARPEDYDTWLALRVIGEAVSRTRSTEPDDILAYALSDEFELAAFKGEKVTFRDWNGQLRQPILLYDGSITVSVSPQDGYLHQTSVLDTLGLDRPETKCTAFKEKDSQ
jgi:ABC transporter substrate binding protein (PQQ-dependent alcohol dehydrogenase system)